MKINLREMKMNKQFGVPMLSRNSQSSDELAKISRKSTNSSLVNYFEEVKQEVDSDYTQSYEESE